MSRTDIFFTALVWIGSLMFVFFIGHEFGISTGIQLERMRGGYRFDVAQRAFK
jgi:hypothetical protein